MIRRKTTIEFFQGTLAYIMYLMIDETLSKVISVPYVPILGPVHPKEISSRLLRDIKECSRQKVILPYDKTRRWHSEPIEAIKDNGVIYRDNSLIISTTTKSGDRHYIYGDDIPSPASGTIITVSKAPRKLETYESCTVVFLDDLASHQEASHQNVFKAYEIESCYTADLCDIGDEGERRGFEMLKKSRKIFSPSEPTLAYFDGQKVLGAIGPLTILKDSLGVKRLLPSYFGVSTSARNQGIGSALWAAARIWASERGAEYQIFQAEYGSPAEYFYRHQKATCLGYVYKSRRK